MKTLAPVVRMSTVPAGLLVLLALSLFLAHLGQAAMTSEDKRGPINVLEYGASGSEYQTVASTVAGKKSITVADPGDFRAGQEVMINGAYVHYQGNLLGPGEPYSEWEPLRDEVRMRGYTGASGSWLMYILEIDGAAPLTFRWSDDLARSWAGRKIPVTFDWQPLSGGTEVRFMKRDLAPGNIITFSARDQLVTTIEAVSGQAITLRDAPNRTTDRALVRHSDTSALQAAIDRAIEEKRNVFFPAGRYRLTRGLTVRNAAAIQIEGAGGETTTIDISDGIGSCFSLDGGTEVTIRNFRMVGHTGLAEAAGSFTTSSGYGFWACALKPCNAVSTHGTERVLIENVHASRMANECFYSQGPERQGTKVPAAYTKELTYLRCWVTDCAFNAFNNNDMAENTSVINCRIDGADQAWEGPSRFIRLIGNYVRNAGPFIIGDKDTRSEDLYELGCGQTIVSGNVFEEGAGRESGILVQHGPTQVIISDNLFINYTGAYTGATSAAIEVSGYTYHDKFVHSFPSRNVTVTGNIIDMLRDPDRQRSRIGIQIGGSSYVIIGGASDVIVSNNQVYVRGPYDPRVTGIMIDEPSVNVNVHGNLIENCGEGIRARRAQSSVTEVIDSSTFRESQLPLEWRTSQLYRDWKVLWLKEGKVEGVSVLDSFDPQSLVFRLKEPRSMHVGDEFEVAPSQGVNWSMHDNTITGCLHPVVLDAYGSSTSVFARNTISRGGATGVMQAIDLRGRFSVIGNTFSDFDEPGASVLSLYPDVLGSAIRNTIAGNTFENCARVVAESREGLWNAADVSGNVYRDCREVPASPAGQGLR
jgi:hypothetical protein